MQITIPRFDMKFANIDPLKTYRFRLFLEIYAVKSFGYVTEHYWYSFFIILFEVQKGK